MSKPAKFVQKMKQGIPDEYVYAFFSQLTADKIAAMYDALRPTPAAVAARIVADSEQ